MPSTLIRRTARLREAGPQGIGRGSRLLRRFSPASIPGLVAWFDFSVLGSLYQDAAMTTPAVADADPIGGVRDLSGAGNHATQSTAGNRPTLALNAINGRSAGRFVVANSHHLLADSLAALFSGEDKPFTLFAVSELSTTTGVQTLFGVGSSTGTNQIIACRSNATQWTVLKQDDSVTSATVVTGTGDATTSPQVLTFIHPGTTADIRVNGVSEWITSNALNVGVITTNRATVGALRRSITGNYFGGDIGECALYTRALTAAEVATVEDFFGAKWAIALG